MLLRLLKRSSATPGPANGFLRPKSGKELLAPPRRQQMIKMLWDLTSLTQRVFDEYLLAPVARYAELVQELPASESHHHAYSGGMLDHALEMACYGLRLRQQHLLPPGAKPEDQSSAGELWSAAVVYGALMHDVAKVVVDIEIHLEDGSEWRVWHGTIPGPYRVKYRTNRQYNLHSAVNPILCQRVLGAAVMDWLITQPKLFAQFMYTIAGHSERGGIIAELVHKADKASVAKALGGDPAQALAAPLESIQRKLAEGLRYLVKDQFKLNQKGGQGWLTDDALWLVSPRAINDLKTHLYSQGVKSIPADLNRLYGELQAHGIIEEVSEGKSVWKCTVIDGEWRQSFNMIKVPRALVWGVEEKPKKFDGVIEIEGGGENINKETPEEIAKSEGSSEPAQVGEKGAMEVDKTSIEKTNSDNDDILSLFPVTQKHTGSLGGSANEHVDNLTANDAAIDVTNGIVSSEPSEKPHDVNDLGERFWAWLKAGLTEHSIVINDSKAQVHVVNGAYFLVSPGIFKRFSIAEFGNEGRWKEVQKKFQKLDVHVRQNGQNIHEVFVQGPNKKFGRLKGYLIKEGCQILDKIPPDNWALSLESMREKEEAEVGESGDE